MSELRPAPGPHVALIDKDGRPTREFYQFLAALIAYLQSLEARVAALEP